MPPVERFVPRFAAEPPQGVLPSPEALRREFLAAVARMDNEGQDVGDPGELRWYPDRTWGQRTYVPVTAPTTTGMELFGYVSFEPEEGGPAALEASADFTADTAERNPDWQIDISEDVVGIWRGEREQAAEMTLIWGVPLISGARMATAELSGLVVDQCAVHDDTFSLLAPDAYRSDYLEVKLWDADERELASESLYVEDDEDEDSDQDQASG